MTHERDDAKPTVALVTTIRSTLRQTLDFVNYHRSIGVDRFFLFLDDPADDAIANLHEREYVTSIVCDDEYWNAIAGVRGSELTMTDRLHFNGNRGFSLAAAEGIDWVVRIDGDELIYSAKPLHSLLEECDPAVDVLSFPTAEAIPFRLRYERPFVEVSWFRAGVAPKIPKRLHDAGMTTTRRLGTGPPYSRFRERLVGLVGTKRKRDGGRYYRGHVGGKSAVRTSALIQSTKSHFPVPKPNAVVKAAIAGEALLLHYDGIDFDTWRRKWEARYQHPEAFPGMGTPREAQYGVYAKARTKGTASSLRRAYRKLHFVRGPRWLSLRLLGFVQQISLDARLFDSPDQLEAAGPRRSERQQQWNS